MWFAIATRIVTKISVLSARVRTQYCDSTILRQIWSCRNILRKTHNIATGLYCDKSGLVAISCAKRTILRQNYIATNE